MSKLFILKNRYLQYQLAQSLARLSEQVDACYKLHGETETSIRIIEDIVSRFCKRQLGDHVLKRELTAALYSSGNDKEHGICRLIFSKRLKVSIHIAPSETTFPQHKHPNAINILIPLAGSLSVTQYNGRKSKTTQLEAKRHCSVGLKQRYNQHSLRVTSPLSIFISVRFSPSKSLFQQLQTKLIYGLGFLLLPVYANASFATVMSDSNCVELAALVSEDHAAMQGQSADSDLIVRRAHQIRSESNEYEALYTAAALYKKAALKDHPEAQYWLGYMLLKGIGITEDSDKALHWIAASSDQEYLPAQKLLDYILTHEPALEC